MTLALLLPPLFSGLPVLCVTAFVLGLAHQVFSIPLEAIVGGIDGAKNRTRNYAFITMGWSAANFFGPLIAGFTIDYVGQLEVYLVLAVLTAAPIPVLLAYAGSAAPSGGEARRGGGTARQRARPVAHALRADDHHCRGSRRLGAGSLPVLSPDLRPLDRAFGLGDRDDTRRGVRRRVRDPRHTAAAREEAEGAHDTDLGHVHRRGRVHAASLLCRAVLPGGRSRSCSAWASGAPSR